MNTTDTTNKQVFTTGEAAELCNVSQQTIIRCFDQGRLDGFRVPGSRFRRIPRASLLKFMQDNGIPAVALEVNRCNVLVISDDLSHVDALCSTVNDQKVSVHPVCTAVQTGCTETFWSLTVEHSASTWLRSSLITRTLHRFTSSATAGIPLSCMNFSSDARGIRRNREPGTRNPSRRP